MLSGPCRLDRRARACGAQDGSGKIVQRREEAGWRRGARDKEQHGGRGSRSGRIGPVPYCTGEGGSWHAKEASLCIQEPADLFACQIVNLASLLYALGNVRCSLHLAKPLRDPVCRLGAEYLYGREPAVYGLRRIVAPLGQEQQEFLDVLCRELAHAHLRCIGAPLVAQPSEHKREHIAIRRDALRRQFPSGSHPLEEESFQELEEAVYHACCVSIRIARQNESAATAIRFGMPVSYQ
jgi:hypothetical protein